MARAAYLAPGVYVEEVPSAQQPIAGVGTNTVGFLGIVPDEIQYPVPNEDYDPVLARRAAGGAGEAQEIEGEKRRLEDEIRQQEGLLKESQDAQTQLKQQLDAPGLEEAAKNRLNREKARRDRDVERITAEINNRKNRLAALTAPPGAVDAKYLKPYKLETFKVTVDPGVTRLCTNFSEYTNLFGPFSADQDRNPGEALAPGHRALTHAVYGFFKNGGTRCFVARVKSDNAAEIDRALTAFGSIDAIAIIAAPGLTGKAIWSKLVAHCENCEDRFAILEGGFDDAETSGDLDVTLLNYDTQNNVLPDRNKNAAFYVPWIEVMDPAKQLQDVDPVREVDLKYRGRTYVPPSGHIAGIYARTDEERGVHKAPANAAVLGALNVKYYISKAKQELLNPQGVNCIRNMNGNITVWGARTVGGDKNAEWKYINVRRFFLFLRESIDEGTQWVVFEPNDPALWGKIRRNVSAFLTNVWRSGALFGLTPEEAFYVKCDAETNPPEVRDLGMVVTEIGVAIIRPAEFVIFRITQSTGPRTS
jgi:phage tail sheath protein FI